MNNAINFDSPSVFISTFNILDNRNFHFGTCLYSNKNQLRVKADKHNLQT